MTPADFDRDKAIEALARLVDEVISDPSKRRDFRKDPQSAAPPDLDLGPDGPIPQKVVKMLQGLSGEELRLLVEVNKTFTDAGLHLEDPEHPEFRILMPF